MRTKGVVAPDFTGCQGLQSGLCSRVPSRRVASPAAHDMFNRIVKERVNARGVGMNVGAILPPRSNQHGVAVSAPEIVPDRSRQFGRGRLPQRCMQPGGLER